MEIITNNLLLLFSFIAFISLNAIDAVLTIIANRRGHPELIPFTRKAIKEFGLHTAMLLKSVLPLLLVAFVILGWDKAEIGFYASLLFNALAIYFFCIVSYDLIQMRKSHIR